MAGQTSRFKSLLVNGTLAIFSFTLATMVVEAAVRAVGLTAEERSKTPDELFAQYGDFFLRPIGPGQGRCTFADSVAAHPFFGWAMRREGACATGKNFHGFENRYPMPIVRDSKLFSVLLLGGSVAGQLSRSLNSRKISWIESKLNEKYLSPNGQPFRVYNGANGGWALPTQLIVLSLYSSAVDAAISVDGYNESFPLQDSFYLDVPDAQMVSSHYLPEHDLLTELALNRLRRVRRWALGNTWARRSYLAYFLFRESCRLAGGETARSLAREEVDDYFSFPEGWTKEAKDAWNARRYIFLEKQMTGISRSSGILFAHFIQPMPLIDKILTPEEARVSNYIKKGTYEHVLELGRQLRREGNPTFLLADVFHGETGTIYADHVHCKFDGNWESRGYEILSDRIVADLAQQWHLRRKPKVGMAHVTGGL